MREVLVHPNYLSMNDIRICVQCDIGPLSSHPGFPSIKDLHKTLCDAYAEQLL